jgi:uridylate kinase
MTAIKMEPLAEPYIRRRARRHLEKGASSFSPAAPAIPLCDDRHRGRAASAWKSKPTVLLKATKVDGVYSEDPEKNPHAMLYSELTYSAVLEQKLRVMDPTAITQCMEHDMPILVFNYRKEGNIERAVNGERLGTIISSRAVGEGLSGTPRLALGLVGIRTKHESIQDRTVAHCSE